jgi:hypothetical protein
MDNNNMKTIKFLKDNYIKLNGITYKPYTICGLPDKFGTEITEWFNYKGLTYIAV